MAREMRSVVTVPQPSSSLKPKCEHHSSVPRTNQVSSVLGHTFVAETIKITSLQTIFYNLFSLEGAPVPKQLLTFFVAYSSVSTSTRSFPSVSLFIARQTQSLKALQEIISVSFVPVKTLLVFSVAVKFLSIASPCWLLDYRHCLLQNLIPNHLHST